MNQMQIDYEMVISFTIFFALIFGLMLIEAKLF